MRKRRLATGLVATVLLALPVQAHGSLGSLGPFWSGALHLAISPLAVAAIVGTATSIACAEMKDAGRSILASGVAAGILSLSGDMLTGLAPLGVALLGVLSALAVPAPTRVAIAFGVAGGATAAAAASIDSPGVVASLGAAFGVAFALMLVVTLFQEIDKRQPLARRIVGAWVAAIGLLVGALFLRTQI